MNRRSLILGSTSGVAASILSVSAVLGQEVEAQGGPREQSAYILSDDFWCGSHGFQRFHYVVQIFAYNREWWRLSDSRGPIRLSLPHFEAAEYEYVYPHTTFGYNVDGFRPVRGKRFGVRVPCGRKYRREIELKVWISCRDHATGSIMEFRGKGRPGRWLWLKHVRTRSSEAICTDWPETS